MRNLLMEPKLSCTFSDILNIQKIDFKINALSESSETPDATWEKIRINMISLNKIAMVTRMDNGFV